MKYYAVKVGNNPGLFDNWAECQESIKGFSGAVYKSFNSKEEAEAFLSDRDIWGEQIAADIEQDYLVAFCDGSFDKELNRYSCNNYRRRPYRNSALWLWIKSQIYREQ